MEIDYDEYESLCSTQSQMYDKLKDFERKLKDLQKELKSIIKSIGEN